MTCFEYQSPTGPIELQEDGGRLCRVVFRNGQAKRKSGRAPASVAPYVAMLEAYFSGERLHCSLDSLCMDPLSRFQRLVYRRLMEFEFGSLTSYGELATLCGMSGAARAIGRAMATNPMPIIVPCHRVVTADGRIGGFSAGRACKRWLLEHEGWTVRDDRILAASADVPRL